jgi:E2F-associated phosphoprotein
MVHIEHINGGAAARAAASDHVVVSGEESDDIFPQEDDTDDDEEFGQTQQGRPQDNNQDDLYDENLDAEDEAYVYKNMRGGVREMVTVLRHRGQQHENDSAQNSRPENNSQVADHNRQSRQQLPVYKPRNSDAVLSCPCCFNIVCMDCQRHSRYHNQFRAIFVMGITVDWHKILVHDPIHQALIPRSELPSQMVQGENSEPNHHAVPQSTEEEEHLHSDSLSWLEEPASTRWRPPPTKEGEYFAVECASCQTQVAALDMREEVYHFHGCLESSAPSY